MTRDAAIQSYCRTVGQKLTVPAYWKRKLLAGLRQELEERFSVPDSLTLEEISEEVGPAVETAYALMENVPAEEQEMYRIRQKRLVCCVIAGLVLLIAACVSFWYYTAKTQIAQADKHITYLPDVWLTDEGEIREGH